MSCNIFFQQVFVKSVVVIDLENRKGGYGGHSWPVCFVVPDVLEKLAFLFLLATGRPTDEDNGGVLAYTRGIEEFPITSFEGWPLTTT